MAEVREVLTCNVTRPKTRLSWRCPCGQSQLQSVHEVLRAGGGLTTVTAIVLVVAGGLCGSESLGRAIHR